MGGQLENGETVAFHAERQTLVNSVCFVSLTLWHVLLYCYSGTPKKNKTNQ